MIGIITLLKYAQLRLTATKFPMSSFDVITPKIVKLYDHMYNKTKNKIFHYYFCQNNTIKTIKPEKQTRHPILLSLYHELLT